MQTIVSQLEIAFRAAISAAFGIDADPLLTVAQNEKFGDYQSNAAMGLAKVLSEKTGQKTNPRAVAEQIKAKLDLKGMGQDVSIAGPGFINVRLAPQWLALQLRDIATDERLGIEPTKNPQNVVVDYSGPNIAKQMHVGHLRSTIIGDTFVRVLGFLGHNVIRQNHVGDWGLQMGMVTFAVRRAQAAAVISYLKKTRNLAIGEQAAERASTEASVFGKPGETIRVDGRDLTTGLKREEIVPADEFKRMAPAVDLDTLGLLYKNISGEVKENPTLRDEIIAATRKLQRAPKDQLTVWLHARAITLQTAQEIYSRLGVLLREEDVRGESDYSDEYDAMVASLRRDGKAVETDGAIGIFPPGFTNKENEPRPFIIQSRDGTYQYPTFDLAALRYRVQTLHAQRIIYTHDARQAEHFEMLFAVARMLMWAEGVELDFAPFGTMLGEDGKPFKGRQGEIVKLKDLLDEAEERALAVVREKNADRPEDLRLPEERLAPIAHAVGIGAVKYSDLSKDRTSDYMFSWDKMLTLNGNTAPYLQYAYARIASIFRKAGGSGAVGPNLVPQLHSPFEQSLATCVLRFQEIINLVARELKPHYLCTYLYELASKYSSFHENCEVLKSEEPTRSSRLLLIDITRRTLALGLDLLGIEHPEQM